MTAQAATPWSTTDALDNPSLAQLDAKRRSPPCQTATQGTDSASRQTTSNPNTGNRRRKENLATAVSAVRTRLSRRLPTVSRWRWRQNAPVAARRKNVTVMSDVTSGPCARVVAENLSLIHI